MQKQVLDNERALDLLQSDPGGFLLAHQETVRIIVRKYVSSGMFIRDEYDDVVQTVNEELLNKLPKIRTQYNGSTLVKTYLSAIIRNICLKLHESRIREPESVHLDDTVAADPVEFADAGADRGLIERARRLFQAILQQYDHRDQLPRLLFHLKLRYRLPLTNEDIFRWYPGCRRSDLNKLLGAFGGNYENMEEKEIYSIITPVANKARGKENTEDAVRKWTRSRIEEILELLNGSPPTSRFDEESLGVLLEDYFSPFLRA